MFINFLEATCTDANLVQVADLVKNIITVIRWGVPVVIVILAMIDLGKAVTSQKEDEIKKATSGLVKRLIFGVVFFLVPSIVGFVLGLVAGSSEGVACFTTFLPV